MKYIVLILLLCAAPASHARGSDVEGARGRQVAADSDRQGDTSLSEAAKRVQKSTGGRVVSAQTVQEDGRRLHRIKVLTQQGEVRIVYVDAATGNIE